MRNAPPGSYLNTCIIAAGVILGGCGEVQLVGGSSSLGTGFESIELHSLAVSFSACPARVSTSSNCWLLFTELVRALKHHPCFCSPGHVPFVYQGLEAEAQESLLSSWRKCFNFQGMVQFGGACHTTISQHYALPRWDYKRK